MIAARELRRRAQAYATYARLFALMLPEGRPFDKARVVSVAAEHWADVDWDAAARDLLPDLTGYLAATERARAAYGNTNEGLRGAGFSQAASRAFSEAFIEDTET